MQKSSDNKKKSSPKEKVKIFIGKYLRLILGIVILIFGILFMFIPFIPLGYLFIFMSLFFLATFIPPLRKLLRKLRKKDSHGIVDRAERETDKLEKRINDKLDQSN